MTAGPRLIQLVEDDASVQRSLAALLETWRFEVQVYGDGDRFLGQADACDACCILLDVRLPGRDGLSVLTELRSRGIATPVIVITGHGDVPLAVRAIKSGAQDFIEKPFDGDALVERIQALAGKETDALGDEATSEPRFGTLTPRETEVMRLVVAGNSNKEIARALGVSPKTIEVHRARVMRKTGAPTLSHLIRLAIKSGIDPEAARV
ncbi:MAG: response regulator transcription factor [Geminicoccaceae bacterium]